MVMRATIAETADGGVAASGIAGGEAASGASIDDDHGPPRAESVQAVDGRRSRNNWGHNQLRSLSEQQLQDLVLAMQPILDRT